MRGRERREGERIGDRRSEEENKRCRDQLKQCEGEKVSEESRKC
jgi:hypothetical protein